MHYRLVKICVHALIVSCIILSIDGSIFSPMEYHAFNEAAALNYCNYHYYSIRDSPDESVSP